MDYDGTLTSFHPNPKNAFQTPELLEILTKLSDDSRNEVVINSGRDRRTLDAWLGHLPIGFAAEHGAFYKVDGVWNKAIQKVKWDKEITGIFEHISKRTPNSKVEVKDTALVWHFRNVDVWLADLRVTQLINALIGPDEEMFIALPDDAITIKVGKTPIPPNTIFQHKSRRSLSWIICLECDGFIQ